MDAEKVHLLVGACITYGHLGYLNLEDQELVCLYDECLIISWTLIKYIGDIESHYLQLRLLLAELKGETFIWQALVILIPNITVRFGLVSGDIWLLLMAKRYGLLNNFQKAIMLYENAINISRKLGEKEREKVACESLVFIYNTSGNYHKMKEYSEMCVKLGEETGDKLFEGCGYIHLGIAISRLGNYEEAISSSEKSIEIALERDDKPLLATAYKNIADDYIELGKHQQAKKYLEKSLKMFKDLDDREGKGKCYSGLGSVCLALGEPEEAEKFYREALDIFISLDNKESEGISYANLANLCGPQYHKAIQYLNKALTIFKDIGNRRRKGEVYFALARVYNSIGKLKDSRENLEESRAIAIETGNKLSEINCCRQLGLVYLI